MKPIKTFLTAFVFAALLTPQLRATTVFPIATNLSLLEFSCGIAFGGTNYLVGMAVGTNVVGQLVSSNGTLQGSQIIVGSNPGTAPPSIALAFGQTNYLLAWLDNSVSSGVDMFGQFISRSGLKVGSKFNLLSAQGSHGFQYLLALATDGTNFLVVWQENNTRNVYGQMVTPAGTLSGAEFLISSQQQNGHSAAVTFGRANYLVVWQSNNGNVGNTNQAYGEFVSPNGSQGSPFQISVSASSDQNPATIGFDGTNYLVVWNYDQGSGSGTVTNWDLYARLVSPAGALLGMELQLVTDPGSQIIPSLAFDGSKYLLSWGDEPLNSDGSLTTTNYNIHAKFLDHSGSAIGSEFTIFQAQGTNTPLFAFNGLLFDGTRFAMAATLGIIARTNGHLTGFPSSEVYGGFIPTNLPLSVQFTASPTNGAPPLTVQFNCPGVDSSGSNIVSWNWNFGDGGTSTLRNPSHVYSAVGTYAPSLVATNGSGVAVVGIGPGVTVANPFVLQAFTNLHNFTGSEGTPAAGLTLSGNALYGTTMDGGDSFNGTVFKINTDGSGFTTLYSFTGGNDGGNPQAELFVSSNTLYGTTISGGISGNGVIFKLNTDGSGFTNLHSFTDWQTNSSGNYTNSDGFSPWGCAVVVSGSNLYGAAERGGVWGWGTVFKVKTDGTGFTNLYSFTDTGDGAYPLGGLIVSGGRLYGTSDFTVFAINTNGSGFSNLCYVASPVGNLILSGNTLYGADYQSVFKVNTDGTGNTILHLFSATDTNGVNGDGASAWSGLALSGNTLYGTAQQGGNSANGTVFAVNTDGTGFTTLHSFTAPDQAYNTNSDGGYPNSGVVVSGNAVYGTAFWGGSSGLGTVFGVPLVTASVSAPRLAIRPSGTSVIVSWPTNATGFTLQSTTNLAQAVWSTNLPLPVVVSGQNTVTNLITGKQQFYRLSQ